MKTLLIALAVLAFPGCCMSLETAHQTALSNRAVTEIGGAGTVVNSSRCTSLDNAHRTWGGIAVASGLLAGTGGVTTLPIPDGDKTARVGVALASLVAGAFAATSIFVQQDLASTWARECTGNALMKVGP